jgi:hypothetical protein
VEAHYRGADKSLARPGGKKGGNITTFKLGHPVFGRWHTMVHVTPNICVRMALISNDTTDSVLRHRELVRAKDLSAPLCFFFFSEAEM